MNPAPTPKSAFQNVHLTEDQIDDHLLGDLATTAAGHLASCVLCTARVAEAAAPMASFRAVSLAWGERVSAAAPLPQIAAARNQWPRSLAWSLALAACALGIGISGVGRHLIPSEEHSESRTEAFSVPSDTPSADQLSNDNQLLNAIDREVSSSSESPASLGLMPVRSTRAAANGAVLIRTSIQD